MTSKELSQLYYLNREISQDKDRLQELETVATGATARITGLPHANSISDKTALAADIADIRAVIETKSRLCIAEYSRLMRYITEIDDSFSRQILALRHIDGLNWRQIAMRIGGNNTEDNVRQFYSRFLKRNR